ncbi:MAG: hypothetical protein QOJ83_1788 [Frankiales bacterium]|nr:hypothetical protein [Frankiales bacterium]
MSEPQSPDASHLGLETIADLDEGLLSRTDAEAAREHLAGCARCQDDQAALATVREALAGERELAMPDDVADRIFGVIAALPPLTAAPATAAVTTLPAPRRPGGGNPAAKPVLVALGAAAAIALLVLGAVTLSHSSSSSEKAASAAGTGAASVPIRHSGRDYDTAGLGNEALSLLPGGTPYNGSAGTTSAAASAAAASAGAPVSAAAPPAAGTTAAGSTPAGPAASGGSAATSAATRAPDRSSAPTGPRSAAATTDPLAALRVDGAAQACLMTFEPRSGTPLAIDFATLAGKPAVIGVFTDPDRSDLLRVVAVGPPGCSLYSFARPQKP